MIKMTIVDRTFTKKHPDPEHSEALLSRISDFFDKSAIVVLGDPGSGKTTSFVEVARIKPDAEYVKIRDFLALSPSRFQGKILYLDGLDEQRAKTLDGSGVLDQIRTKLDELGCPPFRLSCRTYDWYGSSDLSRLSLVSKDSSITVLSLDPLTEKDIRLIVEECLGDSDAFIEKAKQLGIYELFGNPQNLDLIIEVISKQGRWPETRSDIFRQAVKILSRETNEEHARTETGAQSIDAIVEKSGYLCAIQLCSGIEGFSRSSPNASDEYPYVEDLPGDTTILRTASERRLFRSEGPERVAPLHRTVSEYAAANYLTNLVRKGFPIGRVLALVRGSDGGILSDLRGLFSWMACLCQDYAESLIPKDPLGVVLYGDPKILSTSNKKLVFESFKRAAEQDPWFRADQYSSHPFGGLCSTDMETYFRDILEDTSQHPVVIDCVLDAICNGIPMPDLGGLLINIIRSNNRHEFIRVGALEAFQNACPDRTDFLKQLLENIHVGNINDDDCRLRGMLLEKLYPDIIKSDEILYYLVNSPENVISRYFMFVHHDLVKRTPASDLPKLIDTVAISDPFNRSNGRKTTNKHMWEGFIGKLLVKTITEYGNNCPVSDLYRWLGLAVNKYGYVKIDHEESEAVRRWLEEHSGHIFDLFEYWLSITASDDLHKKEHYFWGRLNRVRPPKGFAQLMLRKVEEDPESQVSGFLFLTAANYRIWNNREDAPTVEELIAFVKKFHQFEGILHEVSCCEIPEWRIEDARRDITDKLAKERIKSEHVKSLTDDLEGIRSGEALGHLNWLAQRYFDMWIDSNHDISPKDRLVEATNSTIASAALEGFSVILSKSGIPSPEQIGALKVKSRQYNIGLPVLVGMDTVADLSIGEILFLPDETLKAALVFHYLHCIGHERSWVPYLINKRPILVSEALESFWRPLFKNRLENIPGLYELHQQEDMAVVANRMCLPLLKDFPNCEEEHLRDLLRSALLYADHQELIQLSCDILNRKGAVKKSKRVLWFATAFMLDSDTFNDRLVKYVAKDNTKIVTLVEFIMRFMEQDRKSKMSLSLSVVKTLIVLNARIVTPIDDIRSDRDIRNLLNYLENDTSVEASETLKDLIEKRLLSAWRDTLKHSLSVQLRKRREAEFRYPSLNEVVSTLDNLSPSNHADLQALVLDYLLKLSNEIRHSVSDGYKMFWNVDQYSRPNDPRPENDGRDRLLERLRRDLSRLDIWAEREGDYADHKETDIKVLYNDMNLPIEIKRHYHAELWTAPKEQLIERYTRDPGTGGRGIYLVLWYGMDYKPVKKPPSDIPRPETPEELKKALRLVIPNEYKELIKIIVFDVSKS